MEACMNKRIPVLPSVFLLFLAVPIYWLLVMSFKTISEVEGGITLIPRRPTLENYLFMLDDAAWYWGYLNALIYVLINVVISVCVAVPAAYAFSRYRFPGDRALFFAFLAFRMMAPAILLVPFVQLSLDLGIFDTHWAVAIAHCFFNVPLAVWILEGFISAVPRQIDESAWIDGYSFPRFFFKILLPQIASGVAVTAFFCFMFSWVEFLLANALTAVEAKPIAGIMSRYGNLLAADTPLLAAASVIGLIPGLLLIIFMRKHLARGFSMGRVV
jgi:glycerol transport system permease protein